MMVARIVDAALCDLMARLLVANGLSFTVVRSVLGLSAETIADLECGVATPLQPAELESLALFCAILVRLEIRLGHDPRAMRQILDTPQAVLGDRTPLVAMGDGLDGLRAVHRLAGEMALPATRWWRVGHNR